MTQEDVQLFMSMSMTGSNRNIYSYQAHIWYTRYGSVCQGRVMMYIYICRARTQCSLLCADFYMAMSVCTYGIIYGYTYCNIYIYIVCIQICGHHVYIYIYVYRYVYIYTEIHVYVPVANISYLSTYPYIYIQYVCVVIYSNRTDFSYSLYMALYVYLRVCSVYTYMQTCTKKWFSLTAAVLEASLPCEMTRRLQGKRARHVQLLPQSEKKQIRSAP